MIDQKHTPGPWIARKTGGQGWPGQRGWAIDYNEDQEQVVDFVYEAADAKLIAASPDLLSDLVTAAETLRRYEALHRAKGTTESLEKAKVNAGLAARFEQTIAKATQ
ncbi:hypothetical protein BOW65_09565 [Pseudomonas koreensis]|uniref:hypothetical protein n=1 Tax=Pseudomonas koreensis TaxID=198620 RepID=UPI00098486E2|nr:hypothetical protein [Pseudomonas koreensis]OOH81319.1 hypothetical protein BOW65_09565 [Pseudomonas koreensis]